MSSRRVRLPVPEGLQGQAMLNRMGRGWVWRGPSHQHEELELNLVRRGRASVVLERRRYELTAGVLLWLFPGQPHMLVDTSPDFEMFIAVFRPSLVEVHGRGARAVLRERQPAGHFCRVLRREDRQRLEVLLSRMLGGIDEAGYNAALAWCLVDAWDAFERASDLEGESSVHPAVQRAATLLGEGDPEMPLAELAREVGVSPSWLSRLFHRQMGLTLTDFRNRRRVERFAATLAAEPGLNLTQAAFAAGFQSYPQFYRACVRFLGLPPRAYARQSRPLETGTRNR